MGCAFPTNPPQGQWLPVVPGGSTVPSGSSITLNCAQQMGTCNNNGQVVTCTNGAYDQNPSNFKCVFCKYRQTRKGKAHVQNVCDTAAAVGSKTSFYAFVPQGQFQVTCSFYSTYFVQLVSIGSNVDLAWTQPRNPDKGTFSCTPNGQKIKGINFTQKFFGLTASSCLTSKCIVGC
jgi:hypothetical protein